MFCLHFYKQVAIPLQRVENWKMRTVYNVFSENTLLKNVYARGAAGGAWGTAGGSWERLGAPVAPGGDFGAPGDQYLEKQRRHRKSEKHLAYFVWPKMPEGSLKVEVS